MPKKRIKTNRNKNNTTSYTNLSKKRKIILAFATLLFALAISFKIITKLSAQGKSISYIISVSLLIISLALHYFLIYKREDREIPVFHHRHHLHVASFYLFVIVSAIVFSAAAYLFTGRVVSLSEFFFLIGMGKIMSIVTYEMTD